MTTGYLHKGYAESLEEFGKPRFLEKSGGWVLERRIPGTDYLDAMGCYPLFACRDWSQLPAELNDIGMGLVSLTLVTDPFGQFDLPFLQRCFDRVSHFKDHYVVKLEPEAERKMSRHHRYYLKKSRQDIIVTVCQQPAQFIDQWTDLYANLVVRHQLNGIKAFSRKTFLKQLSLPGTVLICAHHQEVLVAAHIWYLQQGIAYSHLEASSPLGYDLMAAYALYGFALEWFKGKAVWLDLGAGAGLAKCEKDGLARFKKGWSNGTKPVYLCSRIFDKKKYDEITRAKGLSGSNYFPAYRHGEFGKQD